MAIGTLKITSLLIRTVAKPIANTIKAQAKQHPRFRKVCIGFAQWMHRTDYTLRMRLLGEQSAAKIRPLNDTRAIENGATFVSESIIFGVAGGLIVYEGLRSSRQETQRRERIEDDISTLQGELELLKNNLRKQQIQIEEYQLPEGLNPSVLRFPSKSETEKLPTIEEEKK